MINKQNETETVYKTCLELKIESLGYEKEWHRTYKKVLKEFPNIKQVIKLDLFEDKIDEHYAEANFKIKKQHVSSLNIALNRLDDDLKKIKGEC